MLKTLQRSEITEQHILKKFIRDECRQVHQASVCELSSTLFAKYRGQFSSERSGCYLPICRQTKRGDEVLMPLT